MAMPQPSDPGVGSEAARPPSSRKPAARVLARLSLLGVAAWLAWQAFGVLVAYRESRAVARQLPDLPPVHGVPSRRDAGFPVKVWLHRVNSVERAVRMAKQFRGMEIDVMYDSAANSFDVGHPPAPSIGLSLDRLLGAVPDVAGHYFWIDFRNLTNTNAPAACTRLVAIARKYNLISHMIVESVHPTALACFTDNGFRTSYYLFPEVSLPAMNTAQRTAYYAEVKAGLAASNVNALSMSYESLPFVDRYFPDADVLTWYRERDRNLRYYVTLAYLKARSRIQVILIRQMSRGYR
jgi:heptose-I-phosphate ethanolaminephosphotransferase